MGPRAVSKATRRAGGRIAGLKATESVCPYCAVGCGQVVYTRDGELIDIEGNPRLADQPGDAVPEGRGVTPARPTARPRSTKVRYRAPGGTEWEELDARDGRWT